MNNYKFFNKEEAIIFCNKIGIKNLTKFHVFLKIEEISEGNNFSYYYTMFSTIYENNEKFKILFNKSYNVFIEKYKNENVIISEYNINLYILSDDIQLINKIYLESNEIYEKKQNFISKIKKFLKEKIKHFNM
jgi:hypothetical protein